MKLPLLKKTGRSNRVDWPISDHYDGKRFFNPTLEKQFSPGLADMVKMLRQGRPKWPKSMENSGLFRKVDKPGPGEVYVTFVNHASFLIQFYQLNILIDPVWSQRASPISWAGPKRVRKPGIILEELPKIDLILLTHNHYDHLDIRTLKKIYLKFSPSVCVALGDKALMESIGITNVLEMDWWDSEEINSETRITFTPSQHFSARGLFDRYRSLWGGYYIEYGSRSIYFGGDGGYSSHFTDIKGRLTSPEIAILGIGAYAPRFFMKPIHMNPAEAVKAHIDLGARQSIGMHFGTFQLASEAFDQPLADLKVAKEEAGIPEDGFIVIPEGETVQF